MCQEHPERCLPRTVSDPIDFLQWGSTLNDVNRAVNHSIKYRADEVDHFDDAPEYGDCDDYALTKRNILIKRGFDPSVTLFVFVHLHGFGNIGDEGKHAVLAIRTNYGLKIMDNLYDGIYDFDQMMVDWSFIEGAANPKAWAPVDTSGY